MGHNPGMARLLDILALVLCAGVVFFPAPSIQASPAATGDQADLDRMAELEDALQRRPGDGAIAVQLARAYLQVEQPGWALATLRPFLDQNSKDPEVHQVAGFAYATLLRPQEALREAEAGLAACDAVHCPQPARIRLSYLAELMRKPAAEGVDPRKDPLRAKQLVGEALRATKAPAPR